MKTNELELRIFNFYLEDNDIESVEFNFDGGGDDGDINSIIGNDIWGQQHYLTMDIFSYNNLVKNDLPSLILDVFYEIVDDSVGEHGDWVNNEGGYGTLYYDPEDFTFKIDYYQRTTEDFEIFGKPLF